MARRTSTPKEAVAKPERFEHKRCVVPANIDIAFFDLDKTVLSRNSGSMWLKSEYRAGRVSTLTAARAFVWLMRYSAGFVNLEAGLRMAIRSLQGTSEDELGKRVEEFYEQEVRHLVRPGAHAALEAHAEAGHHRVLLTSASIYLSKAISAQLELEHFLANRFEVQAGVFTGEPVLPICYGEGKLQLAQGYIEEQGSSLERCAFYTDSMADLPVLEAVGHPIVVHPDPRLRRLAQRKGWTVVDWS